MSLHLLILSLPTANASARMRAWRALKAAGAAVLRDGVYALPQLAGHGQTLELVAADVRASGGQARLLLATEPQPDVAALFDRSVDWGELVRQLPATRSLLSAAELPGATRACRKLRKLAEQIQSIDFYPGEAGEQALALLGQLELEVAQASAPGEPRPVAAVLPRLALGEHQGRRWATRRRPWVDRLASAWLIRRHIDPRAQFLWLAQPADCPADALGFDFDGATFSHVGERVTFETLLASFALDAPGAPQAVALQRLGVLVHALDAGGVTLAEAAGVEQVLAGLLAHIDDDDALLQAALPVFDGLLHSYRPLAVQAPKPPVAQAPTPQTP